MATAPSAEEARTQALEQHKPPPDLFQGLKEVKRLMELHIFFPGLGKIASFLLCRVLHYCIIEQHSREQGRVLHITGNHHIIRIK